MKIFALLACCAGSLVALAAEPAPAAKKKLPVINLDALATPETKIGATSNPGSVETTKESAEKSAAPTAAPAAPKKPADTKPPKIAGLAIPRAAGGFLGLTLADGGFKLAFYDAKKKPVAGDCARATLRWPVAYQKTEERTSLVREASGKALVGGKSIRPQPAYKLRIVLLKGATEDPAADDAAEAGESFTVSFTP